MKKLFFLLIFTLKTLLLTAQSSMIQILRYNDNFRHLAADSVMKQGFDKLKMIPLPLGQDKFSKNGVRVSFGGEIREQVQHFENQNFGDVPPTFPAVSATQLWHRTMVHADLELGKKGRVFTQLNSTLRLFNPNPLGEIDENQLGLHQAFVEYRPSGLLPTTSGQVSIRVGRQELGYGNNRILTFREGPNNRLAFDAAVFKFQNEKLRVDALVATPVFQKPEIGDDESFKDLILGIYATQNIVNKRFMLDYYLIYSKTNRLKYNLVAGDENRNSLGFRAFSQNPKFNYELEGTYQLGRFNAQNVEAFAVAYDVNYRFFEKKKLTIGVAGNYISGDKTPADDVLNTYNLLFSKPSFGLAAPIGASNIVNINPYVRFSPMPKLQFLASVYFLSRQSENDGIYSPGMVQTRSSRKEILFVSKNKNIGQQYAFEAAYTHNNHWAFFVDGAFFTPAGFVKETGKGQNITYLSAKTSFKF